MADNKSRDRKRRIIKKLVLCIFTIISILGIILWQYTNNQLNNIKITKLPDNNEELGIKFNTIQNDAKEESVKAKHIIKNNKNNIETKDIKQNNINEKYDNKILNIALFGIDSRKPNSDIPHSDCIMITTVDGKHNKIKISSIMRDTYVSIKGHGKTKITEAYFYGGPQLAIRTLNENFNLDIRDYVTIDFMGLAKVVDSLGGISVNIKKYEVAEINKWIKELAELANRTQTPVYKAGIQRLNGVQAVAYCRIRQVGDGDFERTDRQRKVLNEIINKLNTIGITRYPYIVSELLPFVETNLSKTNIITLGGKILFSNISVIEQERFPVDGYCKGEFINKVWYLVPKPDLNIIADQIYKFIYEDIKPVPKKPLF